MFSPPNEPLKPHDKLQGPAMPFTKGNFSMLPHVPDKSQALNLINLLAWQGFYSTFRIFGTKVAQLV
jgi:hypothetical protein